jgi:hypothetical protein
MIHPESSKHFLAVIICIVVVLIPIIVMSVSKITVNNYLFDSTMSHLGLEVKILWKRRRQTNSSNIKVKVSPLD